VSITLSSLGYLEKYIEIQGLEIQAYKARIATKQHNEKMAYELMLSRVPAANATLDMITEQIHQRWVVHAEISGLMQLFPSSNAPKIAYSTIEREIDELVKQDRQLREICHTLITLQKEWRGIPSDLTESI
jgi:citrate synthase